MTSACAIEAPPMTRETCPAVRPVSVPSRSVSTSTVAFVSSHSPVMSTKTCQKAPAQRPTRTSPTRARARAPRFSGRWKLGASVTLRL